MNSFQPERADTGRNERSSIDEVPSPDVPGVRPDLDQLKRRAKELLEAFRSGEAAATAEVNGTTVVRMPLPSRFTTRKWFWHAPVALRVGPN